MSSYANLVSDTYKIILPVIPKSGCTFICTWYVNNILGINIDVPVFEFLHNNNLMLCIDDYEKYKGYTYYLIVRCPIERCISCFINKFVNRYGIKINYSNLEPGIKVLLDKYGYECITFNIFLDIIECELKNEFIDIHINHQIIENRYQNIKNSGLDVVLIKLDDLSFKLADISKQIKSEYSSFDYFKKLNKSEYSCSEEYMDITDINSYDIDPEHLSKMNFKSTFPRILKIYQYDNEIFNSI